MDGRRITSRAIQNLEQHEKRPLGRQLPKANQETDHLRNTPKANLSPTREHRDSTHIDYAKNNLGPLSAYFA